MADADEGLVADGVAAMRGERLALAPADLTASAGGAVLLTGPNGAGKSTLLRVLAGLIPAVSGSVRWRGADIGRDRAGHGSRVGYLGHLDALKPSLTPFETLRLWAGPDAARRALSDAGLASLAELPVRVLSSGQRRRLSLARLALRSAPIWLLDEPTLGLDGAAVDRLGVVLAAHRGTGGVVVAATHLPLPLPNATVLTLSPA